jgi:hypothetical protein
MRKSIVLLAAALLLGAPAAHAAKGVPYQGKATGGLKVSFTLKKNRMWNFLAGVPMTCLPIQGGGNPMTGAEPINWRWVDVGLKGYKFSDEVKPTFHYNEVTRNATVTTRRSGKRVSGSIRFQYQFLVPKWPIGTFQIYSCLGNMKFSARPVR